MPSGANPVQVSVDHTGFTGLNNTDDPMEIGPRALHVCTDYENTQDGRLMVRPGQTSIYGTLSHSIWSNRSKTLCFYRTGSNLMRLNADETSTLIASGFSGQQMIFRDGAAGEVFLTDGISIGMVTGGSVYQDINGIGPFDHFKDSPVAGISIEFWKGRLFVLIGNKAYFSDPHMPFQFDMEHNVLVFAGPITLFRGMAAGLFVADGKIKFLTGTDPTAGMNVSVVADYNAIPHSERFIPGTIIGQRMIGMVLWFATEHGICLGGDDGSFQNITERKYAGSFGQSGAGLFRHDSNINRYVFVGKG